MINENVIFEKCVKCSLPKSNGLECPTCGVIYSKAEFAYQKQLDTSEPKGEIAPPVQEHNPNDTMATNGDNNATGMEAKSISKTQIIFSLIFIIAMLCAFLSDISPPTREQEIDNLFGLNGSHRGLVANVKKSMNDPGSFEHVETQYRDNGNDSITVKMTFRGKNAFGGVVKNWVWAKSDLKGNIIEIISHGTN
jgi:hypothetical protein